MGAEDPTGHRSNGGLIIQTGDNTFIVAGTGVVVTFAYAKDPTWKAGIEQIVEGRYAQGRWQPGRWLNGDERVIRAATCVSSPDASISSV